MVDANRKIDVGCGDRRLIDISFCSALKHGNSGSEGRGRHNDRYRGAMQTVGGVVRRKKS